MIIRKSLNELEKMRRAGLIVAETLRELRRLVEPGITTRQLDSAAEKKIRAIGAYPTFKGYRKFPSSICASVNDEVVHGIPSERKLREGDIVKIDCGATLDGYVGDAAITVPVGNVSPTIEKLVAVTRASLFRADPASPSGHRRLGTRPVHRETLKLPRASAIAPASAAESGRRMRRPVARVVMTGSKTKTERWLPPLRFEFSQACRIGGSGGFMS